MSWILKPMRRIFFARAMRERRELEEIARWQEYRQRLFNHMAQEHGLILLESEMDEIERIVLSHHQP